MRFVNRDMGIGIPARVGKANADAPLWLAAELLARRLRLPRAVRQRLVIGGIAMRPAIDRDRLDVARRIKATRPSMRCN